MKTIKIKAIGPRDRGVRENEVLVSRIVGWYQRDGYIDSPAWTSYKGPTTFISIDSGVEYEIAESMESFKSRLELLVDIPNWAFSGFKPFKPAPPVFEQGRIAQIERVLRSVITAMVEAMHPARCKFCATLLREPKFDCPNPQCSRIEMMAFFNTPTKEKNGTATD